jgi:hypothetical protein
MKNGVDDRPFSIVFIKDDIRESTHECSSILLVHCLIEVRVRENPFHAVFNLQQKFLSEASLAVVVPTASLGDLLNSFRKNEEPFHHGFLSCLTASSQGMADPWACSNLALRWSNSRCCQSGTGKP